MAAGAIVRVLANLIGKHGLARGVKMAQGLGFKNKEIQSAVSKLTKGVTKKPKGFKQTRETWRDRKANRMYYREQEAAYRDYMRQEQMYMQPYRGPGKGGFTEDDLPF